MKNRIFIYYAKNGSNKELHEIIPQKVYECDSNPDFCFLIGNEINNTKDEVFILYKSDLGIVNIEHENMYFREKIHEVEINEYFNEEETIINTSTIVSEKIILEAVRNPKLPFKPIINDFYTKPIDEDDEKITDSELLLDSIIEKINNEVTFKPEVSEEPKEETVDLGEFISDKRVKPEVTEEPKKEKVDLDEFIADKRVKPEVTEEPKEETVDLGEFIADKRVKPEVSEEPITEAEKKLDEIIELLEDEEEITEEKKISSIDDMINNVFGDIDSDNKVIPEENFSELEDKKINIVDAVPTIAIVFATAETTKVGFFTYDGEEELEKEKFNDEVADVKKVYDILTLDLDKEFNMSKDEFRESIENRENAYVFTDNKDKKYYVKTFIYHYMYQTVLSLETFSSGTNLITDKYSEITEEGKYQTVDNGFDCSFKGFETYILIRKQ